MRFAGELFEAAPEQVIANNYRAPDIPLPITGYDFLRESTLRQTKQRPGFGQFIHDALKRGGSLVDFVHNPTAMDNDYA